MPMNLSGFRLISYKLRYKCLLDDEWLYVESCVKLFIFIFFILHVNIGMHEKDFVLVCRNVKNYLESMLFLFLFFHIFCFFAMHHYVSKIDLAMITLVAMNWEWVEGVVVMQMRNLLAGLHIDLQVDIKMESLVC